MFYFILWVVFLLAVIFAVPVTSFLAKRQAQGPRKRGPAESEMAEEKEFGENEGFGSEEEMVSDAEFGNQQAVGSPDDGFGNFDDFK